jgi:wyosine [tRNA(Phe)-imidazoG37] synthetase (radical SAM superfamily)
VKSRRFGLDLGINPLPNNRKLCTFDCIYCQFGFQRHDDEDHSRFASVESILRLWEARLRACQDQGLRVRHTTVAGNGEPTMHPQFPQLMQSLVSWRNESAPYIRIAVLSNGYRIHIPEIRHALSLADEPVLKLDAGDVGKIRQINQPIVRFDLERYVENLKKCGHVILQTMFLKGWNDAAADLDVWVEILKEVNPESVQIYTIDRDPAMPGLQGLDHEELQAIAHMAALRSGVEVHAYL